METTHSLRATVRRFFESGFNAADLAESLISYDMSQPAQFVRERMEAQDLDVVGIRDDGHVVGFVCRGDLESGECGAHLRYFGSTQLLAETATLREVVAALDQETYVFVILLGTAGGIITRADLQKPQMRMWLFGLITLVEHAFGRMIALRYPDDSWRGELSASRLELAEQFQAERHRRNESLDLVSCLQFGDKAHILMKDPEVRAILRLESRSAAKEAVKSVERLRNALAHAQDIVSDNWPTIIELSASIDSILKLYEP